MPVAASSSSRFLALPVTPMAPIVRPVVSRDDDAAGESAQHRVAVVADLAMHRVELFVEGAGVAVHDRRGVGFALRHAHRAWAATVHALRGDEIAVIVDHRDRDGESGRLTGGYHGIDRRASMSNGYHRAILLS